jgi:HEAT repeat protein
MRSWQLWVLISLFLCLTGIAWYFVRKEAEPTYRERPLSYWLEANSYMPGVAREEAQGALRSIGTNAIPFLLKYMTARPGPWNSRLQALKRRVGLPVEDKIRNRAGYSAYAFEALGEQAQGAIRDLDVMLHSAPKMDLYFPASALAAIGRPALPTFISALTNQNPSVQIAVIQAFDSLGTNKGLAAPALLQTLRDPDLGVRQATASLLGLSGISADLVVPALISTLSDSNRYVRSMAGYSLINLGPKAIPALENALSSTNELIRRGAATALQGIPTEFKHDLETP